MKNNKDFAVFILTNGRADKVITYNTIRKNGYTGRIVLMIDDEDSQLSLYKKNYGEEVFVFSKQDAIDITDSGDNFKKRNSVVYARNYNFIAAEKLGIKYFLQLDDDYSQFYCAFDNDNKYLTTNRKVNLDNAIASMLKFYMATNALTLAMSQGGDYIGGEGSKVAKLQRQGKLSRKAMNSFFCSTDRPFKFMGRINEDVNAYTEIGMRGGLFLTYPRFRLEQIATQANSGGLTDIYLDLGTYVKSFYSVMYSPSCVKICKMGVVNQRLHHRVKWKNCHPMIIDEKHKK
jgi:hypothetical protein